MVLLQKRIKARKLRKRGFPLSRITDELQVSKSTVSLWCQGIKLNQLQMEKIRKTWIDKTRPGRLVGVMANKQKKMDSLHFGKEYGKKLIGHINKRELILILIALYWSEGAKSDNTTGFQFINSDPEMILSVCKCLGSLGVKKQDIVCSVQINIIHEPRIKEVLKFWATLLELPSSQFRKPYFVKSKVHKVYENHNTYFGICRVIVRRSSMLKYKMLGSIHAMKRAILPV